MSEELKPCPFCGAEAEQKFSRKPFEVGSRGYGCTKCDAMVSGFTGIPELQAAAWNRRSFCEQSAREGFLTAAGYCYAALAPSEVVPTEQIIAKCDEWLKERGK